MTASSGTPRPRRIAILTYGSRGDVEPFVALGLGLRQHGHEVRLAAPRPYAHLALEHGLEFVPIESDPEELALALTDRAGLSWPRMILRMSQHVLPLAAAAFRSVVQAVEGADAVIHSFMMTDAGHTLAAQRGIPEVSAQLFPVFVTTSAFPGVAAPDLPLGPAYRRLTHILNTAAFKYGGRFLYRKVRASHPELPGLAPWPFDGNAGARLPIVFGYSPRVLPSPPDWPPNAYVTGYWVLPPPDGWTPPRALVRFLEDGPPPVYFGVGSMRSHRMEDRLRAATQAIEATGQRGILGVPLTAARGIASEQFFAVEGIPHAWLFPRMRLVIHHGGAGTTGAAVRAGVPSMATPFTADQAFWGRQIARLGVGPAPLPAGRLTAPRLAAAIDGALRDSAMQQKALELGRAVSGEDGVAAAIQIITHALDRGGSG